MMSRNFIPEQTLLDRLLIDDITAFEELSRRYCYSLYTYCNREISSEEDAKRIVRNIFIEFWEDRHSLPLNFSLHIHLSMQVRKATEQYKSVRKNTTNTTNTTAIRNMNVERHRQIGQPVIDSYKHEFELI